jgi:hypothetical protein
MVVAARSGLKVHDRVRATIESRDHIELAPKEARADSPGMMMGWDSTHFSLNSNCPGGIPETISDVRRRFKRAFIKRSMLVKILGIGERGRSDRLGRWVRPIAQFHQPAFLIAFRIASAFVISVLSPRINNSHAANRNIPSGIGHRTQSTCGQQDL